LVSLIRIGDNSQTELVVNGDFSTPTIPNKLTNNYPFLQIDNNIDGWVGFPKIQLVKGNAANDIAWTSDTRLA
jgi:hypothetical protein